jgi:hypothetical protein
LGQLLADDDRVRLVRLVLFPKGVAAEYRDTERLEVILPDGELGSAVDRPRVSGSVQLKTESIGVDSARLAAAIEGSSFTRSSSFGKKADCYGCTADGRLDWS